MILQNRANSLIIEIDPSTHIDKSALALLDRVICFNNSFPIAIIGG